MYDRDLVSCMCGCSNNLQEPDVRGVHRTLPGHEGLVTALCFFSPKLFVSGDDKGTLKIWTNEDERVRPARHI
jgi:WD40 repeat protein